MSYKEAVEAYDKALDEIMRHKLQSMALGVLQEAFKARANGAQLRQVTELFKEHIRIWGHKQESA